jgi:hypothetical protein
MPESPPKLPPPLRQIIDSFEEWQRGQLEAEQKHDAISSPLHHYTDLRALRGIIETGEFWFTDYRHLNDPSELTHGVDVAHEVARAIAERSNDNRVRAFVENLLDLFRHDSYADTLNFFIASFSAAGDDLGQWRAYADNGHGIALGLSPALFAITDNPPSGRLREFVGRVRYSRSDLKARHSAVLEKAAADKNRTLLSDKSVRSVFFMNSPLKSSPLRSFGTP